MPSWQRTLRANPAFHEVAYGVLAVTTLRHRLRCPNCRSVGTWKPHGGLLDGVMDRVNGLTDTRLVRRWLCKFCGWYEGPEGGMFAFPDSRRGWWALPQPYDPESPTTPDPTPQDVLKTEMGRTWPWRG